MLEGPEGLEVLLVVPPRCDDCHGRSWRGVFEVGACTWRVGGEKVWRTRVCLDDLNVGMVEYFAGFETLELGARCVVDGSELVVGNNIEEDRAVEGSTIILDVTKCSDDVFGRSEYGFDGIT